MKLIPLTRGLFTQVDDEDYEWLAQWKWFASKDGDGTFYARRQITLSDGRSSTTSMHRTIMDTPKGMVTDHKDRDGLNNQRANLRICTDAQNICNQRHRDNAESIYKGVSRCRRQWRAQIGIGGKKIYLGLFRKVEDAARAYDAAAISLHGEFARINFPIADS